jgi:uncharacterized protein (TIGR00251 family)
VISDAPDGAVVDIKVIPRAGSTTLAGTRDGAVLIRLAAAPVDGAANAELIALLARVLAIPKRRIAVISGEKTRSKRVKVLGVSAAMFRERLNLSPDAR